MEREDQSPVEKKNSSTSVWTMRHGPTTWNLERRIQGNVDTHIVDSEIIDYFKRIDAQQLPQPEKIIVTEFQRTHETARQLIKFRKWPAIPLVIVPAFNERKWGIFEGKTHQQIVEELAQDKTISKQYPNLRSMTDLSPIIDAAGFKVGGAESMEEVRSRVEPDFLALVDIYPEQTLLLITHAGVLISLGLDYHKINHCILSKEGDTVQMSASTRDEL